MQEVQPRGVPQPPPLIIPINAQQQGQQQAQQQQQQAPRQQQQARPDYFETNFRRKRELAGNDPRFTIITKKRKRKRLDQISKKAVKKKSVSAFQNMLNKFYKQRLVPEQVDNELIRSNLAFTEAERHLIKSLVSSQTEIQKIGFPRILAKPFLRFHRVSSIRTSFITNSSLYWQLQGASKWNEDLNFLTRFLVKNIYICSGETPIVIRDNVELAEFNVLDQSLNYAIVYVNKGVNFNVNNINQFEFIRSGPIAFRGEQLNQYIVKIIGGNMVFLVVSKGEMTREQLLDAASRAVIVHEKQGLKSGLKVINKGAGTYYFQKALELTNFGNGTLVISEDQDYLLLMEYQVELEEVFLALLSEATREARFNSFKDTILWENFPEYLDFFMLLCKYLNADMELIESITEKKHSILAIRNHYLRAKGIFLKFLDSFPKNVNIDRMKSIIDAINEFMIDEDELTADRDYYNSVVETISNLRLPYILNSFNTDMVIKLKTIREVCSSLLNKNVGIDDVVLQLRACACDIFNLSLMGDNICFAFIRSFYSFLGNTFGDETLDNLRASLANIRERLANNEERRREVLRDYKAGISNKLRTFMQTLQNQLINNPNLKQNLNIPQLAQYVATIATTNRQVNAIPERLFAANAPLFEGDEEISRVDDTLLMESLPEAFLGDVADV